MNPPTIILGGGVHGKACWLIAYYLWSDYKAKTFSKLRVAFNNVYRRVLGLPTWSSVSEMYATHNIENFEALLRKVIYGFIQRLEDSSNVIIQTLTESWTICFVD